MKSITYRVFVSLFSLLLFVSPKYSCALDQIEVSTGILKFDYAEYLDDGSFFDSEKGNIPGISINLRGHSGSGLVTEFGMDFYKATVDYDGGLQGSDPNTDGLPFQTETLETLTGIHIQMSQSLASNPNLSFFGNFGYKMWNRAIQGKFDTDIGNLGIPVNSYIPGFTEKYSWYQLAVGAQYQLALNANSIMDFHVGYTHTMNPRMKLGPFNFKQGERPGYELGFDWLFSLSSDKKIGLGASMSYWEFWELFFESPLLYVGLFPNCPK